MINREVSSISFIYFAQNNVQITNLNKILATKIKLNSSQLCVSFLAAQKLLNNSKHSY